MGEMQTVEVRFLGERLADVMIDEGIFTLYRTARRSYLAVADQDEGLPWLRAIDEGRIRALWPELFEAAGL
jgi:hypothetical protein